MTAYTYSFLNVQCTLNGPGGVAVLGAQSGAAEEGITFEQREDQGSLTIGAGGEGMHSLHADRSGRASIRLLKTSPLNNILQQMFNLQRSSAANWGQNTIALADTNRGDIVTCVSAAFLRQTGLTYAKDGNMNEWAFQAAQMTILLGTGSVV